MKKIILAIALAIGAATIVSAPAQAIDCNAFNQGTARAAHYAPGNAGNAPGIWRIAYACHGL